MNYPKEIQIREVAPRDGLQNETTILSTAEKVALIDMISMAGFPQVNVASFVSPRAVPQMADSAEVLKSIVRRPHTIYDATVPNIIGARNAIAAGVDAINVFVSASDATSRANVNRTTAAALADAEQVLRAGREAGLNVTGTIASAFGSPYDSAIAPEAVLAIADRFVSAGATGLSLGDTTGEGTPSKVADLVSTLINTYPQTEISLHLHDSRGLALANCLASMDAGATHFDSAIGGIGGSPFTANSAGNLPTEELLYLCRDSGIETGVDFGAVLDIYAWLQDKLKHTLPGKVGRLHARHDGD